MTYVLKQGAQIALSQGEYSNYGIDGFFLVLKEFDMDVEKAAFKADLGNNTSSQIDRFIADLIRRELVEPDDRVVEIWLGEYGRLTSK